MLAIVYSETPLRELPVSQNEPDQYKTLSPLHSTITRSKGLQNWSPEGFTVVNVAKH